MTKTKEKICTFPVSLPKSFKSFEKLDSKTARSSPLIEFIPKTESKDNFSEIITVHTLVGSKMKADALAKKLIAFLGQQFKLSVLHEELSSHDNPSQRIIYYEKNKEVLEKFDNQFPVATYIVKYKVDGKEEVLGFKYVSGPFDCVGVQYTIKLKNKLSQEAAVEKINTFFNKNTFLLETRK